MGSRHSECTLYTVYVLAGVCLVCHKSTVDVFMCVLFMSRCSKLSVCLQMTENVCNQKQKRVSTFTCVLRPVYLCIFESSSVFRMIFNS